MSRIIKNQSGMGLLVIIAGFFFVVMLGTPFFAPGLTFDSLIYFFTQPISQILSSETIAGIGMLIILFIFLLFILEIANTNKSGFRR